MTNTVCDGGKATFGWYAANVPTGTSSIITVLLTTCTETDSALAAHLTLATVLSASGTAEASFGGYSRFVTSSGVTVSIASHVVTFTIATNPNWPSAAGTQNLIKLLVCYRPATASADTAIIPLGQYDFVGVTDGSNLTAQVNASGLMAAS